MAAKFIAEDRVSKLLNEYGGGLLPAEASEFISEYFSSPVSDSDDYDIDENADKEDDELQETNLEEVERDFFQPALVSLNPAIRHSGPTPSSTANDDGSTVVENFYVNGCGCSRGCTNVVPRSIVEESRMDCMDLDERCELHYNHQHLVLMGAFNALTKNTEQLSGKFAMTEFRFRGIPVCKAFFQLAFSCGSERMNNVREQFNLEGVVPRVHQNVHRTRPTAFKMREECVKFINGFADQNALVLPGRIPAFNYSEDLKLLPCSMTKFHVYQLYITACQELQIDFVKKSSWYAIWNELCGNIAIQKPRSDLCPECQSNVLSLGRMASLDPEDQLKRIQKSSDHLNRVKEERSYYKHVSLSIQTSLKDARIHLNAGVNAPCSYKGKMHYSFDYAQQIHLPQSSQQVGPLYFLTGYKVALFGIAIEPIGKFVLYIIPESCAVGKGSNVVISMLHHFFENFGLGETDVILHADNCSGQNKNNYVMQYAAWRVAVGLHESIKICFLPVGHTKFSPDLYFGLFKKNFRRSDVNRLDEVVTCALNSCPHSEAIIPFVVGSESGDLNMNTYDWQKFFNDSRANKIPGLLKNYHFKTTADTAGRMQYKKSLGLVETTSTLLFPDVSTLNKSLLPSIIKPVGLTMERKKYLFDKIREYVSDDAKDILCPKPNFPQTTNQENLDDASLQENSADFQSALLDTSSDLAAHSYGPSQNTQETTRNTTAIRSSAAGNSQNVRKCSICRQPGHTKRTCPNNK